MYGPFWATVRLTLRDNALRGLLVYNGRSLDRLYHAATAAMSVTRLRLSKRVPFRERGIVAWIYDLYKGGLLNHHPPPLNHPTLPNLDP